MIDDHTPEENPFIEFESFPEFDTSKHVLLYGRQGGKTAEAVRRLKITGGVLVCGSEQRARNVQCTHGGRLLFSETKTPVLIIEDEFGDYPTSRIEIIVDKTWYIQFDKDES